MTDSVKLSALAEMRGRVMTRESTSSVAESDVTDELMLDLVEDGRVGRRLARLGSGCLDIPDARPSGRGFGFAVSFQVAELVVLALAEREERDLGVSGREKDPL